MRSDLDLDEVKWNLIREGGSLLVQSLLFPLSWLPSRHEPKRAADIHTVVFVHGLGATRSSLFPMATYLSLRGFTRQYSFNARSTRSVESLALELKRRVDTDVRGGRISLVCHSMGGLVARYYLQQLGGARRVTDLVTLGTPHRGTHASAWLPTTLVRQMAPGSAFLTHLNSLPPPPGVRCTSITAGADLLVLPPSAAAAPFGSTYDFDGLGHTGMLLSVPVLRTVYQALDTPEDGVVPESEAGQPKPGRTASTSVVVNKKWAPAPANTNTCQTS